MADSRSSAVVVGRLTALPAPESAESGVGRVPDLDMATYLPYAAPALVLLGVDRNGAGVLHSARLYHRLLVVGEDCERVIAAIKASTEHTRGAVSATVVDPERPDVCGFCCSWGATRLYVMHVQRPACNWLAWKCRVTEVGQMMKHYTYETPWSSTWFYATKGARGMQRCEYRKDCLPERFPGVGMSMSVCPIEEGDCVSACRHRELMPCGHPRLYARRGDLVGYVDGVPQYTWWCAKCKEESEA